MKKVRLIKAHNLYEWNVIEIFGENMNNNEKRK